MTTKLTMWRAVLAVAVLVAITMPFQAHADLVRADDPAFGAGTDGFNLTRDTATGLEWLDLTLTKGLSYNAVAGGAGGFIAAGFSFATESQVSTLFTSAGFTFQDANNHAVDAPSAVLLLNLVGCTVNCTTFAFPAGQGFVDFDVFSSTTAPQALYQAIVSTPGDFATAFTGRAFAQSVTSFSKDSSFSSGGSFLIRPVPVPLTVSIDIMPGSDLNNINLSSAGLIPVAILSSETFDATTVNEDTIFLAGAIVKLAGQSGNFLCQERDVNKDDNVDLVCDVETAEFLITPGDSTAELTAETFDGTLIQGTDSIRIVPD